MSDFTTQTHAKCIIAGEHAVLRNKPALIYPLKNYWLKLNYKKTNSTHLQFNNEKNPEKLLAFIEYSLNIINKSLGDLNGEIIIETNILHRAGLGASAAFCVALSRLFIYLGWLEESNLMTTAQRFENFFHHQSSGVDIAAVLSDTPISYQRQTGYNAFKPGWQPYWALHFSGTTCVTAECIQKVNKLWDQDPTSASQIDQQMEQAVKQIQTALTIEGHTRLDSLADAINQAYDCFKQWGLVTDNLAEQIETLYQHGALAAKPVGSGLGGFVLSLWHNPPPNNTPYDLISIE